MHKSVVVNIGFQNYYKCHVFILNTFKPTANQKLLQDISLLALEIRIYLSIFLHIFWTKPKVSQTGSMNSLIFLFQLKVLVSLSIDCALINHCMLLCVYI